MTRRGPIWPVWGGSGEGDKPPSGDDSGKTFTQADLDRIVGERLTRQKETLTADFADFDTYKAAAEELSKLKDAEKSELDRANGKADELTGQLTQKDAELVAANLRLRQLDIAAEEQLTDPKLIKRIKGGTDDEIRADVKELKELQDAAGPGPRVPRPNGQQGTTSTGTPSSMAAGRERYEARHNKK
ncbi:hypothetical protein [Nocardia sp. NPDC055049]